jgi:hypothetical protein
MQTSAVFFDHASLLRLEQFGHAATVTKSIPHG